VFDKVRVSIWVHNSQDYQRELIIELVSPQFDPARKKRSQVGSNVDPQQSSKKKNLKQSRKK
jgi:hypothetical protein